MDLSQVANTTIILLSIAAAYGFFLTTRIILVLADDWGELKVYDRIGLLFILIIAFGTTYSAVRLAVELATIFA